uniref:Uncharacterized protein n=1 Tax=Sphaerodactylus townsendi TaxID=933632 RepID=A0ACB8EY40_9SAUR
MQVHARKVAMRLCGTPLEGSGNVCNAQLDTSALMERVIQVRAQWGPTVLSKDKMNLKTADRALQGVLAPKPA